MHQDQCIEIARQAAVACAERHDYMPATELLAEVWQPHRWVIDAMLCAATVAEVERDRYQAGNTELLELLMHLIDGQETTKLLQRVNALLKGANLLHENGALNWEALEARKPKQISWEQAVNELVTDPEERARPLALSAGIWAAAPEKERVFGFSG